MAQNTNRAWSDSARDSRYATRSSYDSSELRLPADALPEFRSAFRKRDEQQSQLQNTYSDVLPTQSSSPRPYSATINRDYASRDADRVTRDPYRTLSRSHNTRGSAKATSARFAGSQSTAPRIHAEAFQPMGSHSVAGQKRKERNSSSTRETWREEYDYIPPRNYRNSADFAEQNPRASRYEFADEYADEQVTSRSQNTRVSSKAQKREERRRKRRHEQADKKFNRQFSGDAHAAADAGPRAAVTKAEMGSKHRRAVRAQQNGLSQLPFVGGVLGTAVSAICGALVAVVQGFLNWRTLKKTVCTVVILALICVCVYTPAQQYYQTLRLNDQLEAEYKAIEERNEALGLDLATLSTREGVEARAHEQFGLVQEGEESANVLGLDYTYDHSTTMMAAIPSGSIEMPEPAWYTPLLDAIFGVEKDGEQ